MTRICVKPAERVAAGQRNMPNLNKNIRVDLIKKEEMFVGRDKIETLADDLKAPDESPTIRLKLRWGDPHNTKNLRNKRRERQLDPHLLKHKGIKITEVARIITRAPMKNMLVPRWDRHL